MDLGIISTRYAKALLLFAEQNGEEDKVYTETSTLAEAFFAVPALHQALINPVLTDAQKEKLLLTAACGKNAPSGSIARFVKLVIKKMRADLMQMVALSYGTLYRSQKHIIKSKLVLPTTVEKQLIEKLQQMVEKRSNCKVDFQVKEDASILGGFILEYDTYRLDASVRTQLAQYKRELKK